MTEGIAVSPSSASSLRVRVRARTALALRLHHPRVGLGDGLGDDARQAGRGRTALPRSLRGRVGRAERTCSRTPRSTPILRAQVFADVEPDTATIRRARHDRLRARASRLAPPLTAPLTGGSVRTVDASGNDVELGPDEIDVRTLYRDCMRLTYHIAARSAKGEAMRTMVRAQFKAQMHVTDEAEVRRLKMLAIAGIQNYVIHEQTGKAIAQRGRDAGETPAGGGSS